MVDSIIVGQYLGVNAFAAIGSTNSLNALIIGFAVGLCSGLSIPVAQHFGAGNIKELRKAEANGLYLAGAAGVVISVVMSLCARPILVLLRTPENILDDASAYIGTLFAGALGLMLYNILIGYLRALGDSKTPLFFLILAAILNVLFDLLFIVVFRTGVAGAAWATVLAQLSAALFCIRVIRKNFPVLHLNREVAKLSLPTVGRLSAVALPIGLQLAITAVGSTVLQIAVNSLGSQAVAALAVGAKVQNVLFTALEAIGVGLVIFCSQNYGGMRFDRVRKGVVQTMLALIVYSVVGFAIVWLVGRGFAQLFLKGGDEALHDMVQEYLRVTACFFLPLSVIYVYRNALQGLGYAKAAMGAGLCEMVARICVALFLVLPVGYVGACFASPVAWICADLFLVPMYIYAMRQLEKRKCGGEPPPEPPVPQAVLEAVAEREFEQDLNEP